jgi:putative flippase GtrA
MITESSKERTRFFRFAIVGAIGSALDFALMNVLTRGAGLELVPAGSMSFLCAVLNNFLGNRYWTYPDSRSKPVLGQFGMFSLVNLAGIAIRIPILHFAEPPLEQLFRKVILASADTASLLAKNLSLAAAITIVLLWNFFANRYWTYSDVQPAEGKSNG